MTGLAMSQERPRDDEVAALYRRQRAKNWLVAGLLLGFVVLVFLLSLVRMGDGQ